jgi:alpha-galactosidase
MTVSLPGAGWRWLRMLFLLWFGFLLHPALAAEGQIIRITTAHSALVLCVANDHRLYQLAYGAADKEVAAPGKKPARETEFYPQAGDGFICEPALEVAHADGNTSTALVYAGHQTTNVSSEVTLTRIELKDTFYPFFVTLCFRAFGPQDVIEQWTEIRNEESGPVTLSRFASAAPLFQAKEYWLTQFHGNWADEANLAEEQLGPGIKVLDSKLGVRASQFRFPSFLLALDRAAEEENGEVIGGSLEWSGSYQLAFEMDWNRRVRALCGINPFGSQYHLAPGLTFTTPGMLWSWSRAGKGQVSRNFHRWARSYGVRDAARPRPVLLNNWEATFFNFDEATLVGLFDGAREVGAETFLLDDGWFGNRHPRNNDRAGLGDWQVNTNKLPRGLSYLAEQAKARGVNFGIWLEPEMVNPVSDLFEAHPDWAIRQPHRELDLSRNQLDLDLSRPEVSQFAWKVIDGTLGRNRGISYLKWDANRYVTQPGSTYLPPGEQSHLLIDYTFALYDLMARLTNSYPNVMAMLCSGGGGRADYGALRYFHCFWPSDKTDPASRVFIQWGYSHFFPACTLCAHVTRMGNRPLKFGLDVALSAAFGLDMDLRKVPEAEREQIAAAVALYKNDLRGLIAQADLYRLESPYDGPRAALDYVSPDQARAVLFVYELKDDAGSKPVQLRGLDPKRRYRIKEVDLPKGVESRLRENNQTLDGAALMSQGLVPACPHRYDSAVIELEGSAP